MHQSARRLLRLIVALAIILAAVALVPTLSTIRRASADTDLVIGGQARIAYADGDAVRLRAAPRGDVITTFPEGSVLDVVDGPIEAGDGSLWYEVSADGYDGFIISDYLAAVSGGGGSATTTSSLNLRSGPGTGYSVLAIMPTSASVSIDGAARNGFLPVTWNGQSGFASADYLDTSGGGSGGGGTAITTSDLNLRDGPGTGYGVLIVMPEGAAVTLLGDSSNGFLSVSYGGIDGWASATYLDTGDGGGSSSAVTTSSLNLRDGPSTSAAVLLVMPVGATAELTGDPESGFYPVRYAGTDGWAFGDYLDLAGGGGGGGGSGLVAWPFQSGGAWTVIQGYNIGTHQNRSSLAQYEFSLDWARVDGDTAGQPIYSPVDGVVSWTDTPSGGIAIDMGNGYVVAMFHTTWRSDLVRGVAVGQGEYLGYISGPGENGYAVVSHVDMTLWQSNDGGRNNTATPWSGDFAPSGVDFPDQGGSNQYYGVEIEP